MVRIIIACARLVCWLPARNGFFVYPGSGHLQPVNIIAERLNVKRKVHASRIPSGDFSSFGEFHSVYPLVSAIFGRIFPVLLVLGGVGLSVSLYRSVGEPGFWGAFILHVGIYLSACAMFIFRLRLSVLTVFSFMLSIGYLLAIQSLFSLGLAGTGVLHLVILCTFASVFLGLRAGLITLMLGAMALVVIGSAVSLGVVKTMPETPRYLSSPVNWVMQLSCYLMYMTALVLSVNGLRERAAASMGELRENNERLKAEIDARRSAEEAVKESEARLRQIIDLVPHFIFAKDRGGHFIIANKALADALGTTVENIIGRTMGEFNLSREDVERLTKDDFLVMDSGCARQVPEERITEADGRLRILETIRIPFTLSSTGDQAVLGVSTDITERRQAEEKLRESEIRFEELADSLPQPVAEFDLEGNFTFGNATGFQLFGYSKEEFLSEPFPMYKMLVPGDYERAREAIRRVVVGEDRLDNREYTAVRKDGTTFPIMVYASPVIREGRPTGFRTILVDISERKKYEQALMESEAKYRSVVESSLVGFYIVQDNLFRYVNGRWCEIFGYEYGEVIDRLGPPDIAHPDDRSTVEDNMQKRLTNETDYIEYSFRTLRKDGRVLTVKALGSSIIYDGRPAAAGTVMDITRERQLEAHLRQAQKMEAIGTLTGGIAHDFNNILTALVGYGSLLQMRMEKTDPLRMYVDRILSAAHKASGLTKSLLTFGRQQPINLQPTNLNGIMQGTEQLLKRLLTEDILFQTTLTSENVTIMADATQIDQILFNLVTNARDSMPRGGTLIVETGRTVLDRDFTLVHGFGEPGTYAVLSISDTGTGMSAAVMEKIFEPFFTTKETGKGTGLGLATVYGIVKRHNGYITVYSELNLGTTFRIYFPAIKTRADEEQAVIFNVKRGDETILVAEDNEEVRRFVKDIFKLYGYRIIEAVDGEDAVMKFRQQNAIDLVILDSVMPKMNGREAYDEIVRMKPGVKVLFMSGHTRDILLDKGIQEREFAFIPKPLLPNELLRKVREILDGGN